MTFDEFVEARLQTLLRYATVLTCDPHLAEDIVQEVLVKAHRKWKRIESLAVPDLYVRRMITNQFLSWRRRKAYGDVSLAPADLAELGPAVVGDPARRFDQRDELLARIAGLPRKQRAVLVLRYFCDLADEEIAQVLGCGTGTVRSHASRALAAIRVSVSVELASQRGNR